METLASGLRNGSDTWGPVVAATAAATLVWEELNSWVTSASRRGIFIGVYWCRMHTLH